jgi:hypothetical protein
MCDTHVMEQDTTPTTIRMRNETLARLNAWLKSQDAPPTRTAVVDAALRAWLDAQSKKGRK